MTFRSIRFRRHHVGELLINEKPVSCECYGHVVLLYVASIVSVFKIITIKQIIFIVVQRIIGYNNFENDIIT